MTVTLTCTESPACGCDGYISSSASWTSGTACERSVSSKVATSAGSACDFTVSVAVQGPLPAGTVTRKTLSADALASSVFTAQSSCPLPCECILPLTCASAVSLLLPLFRTKKL